MPPRTRRGHTGPPVGKKSSPDQTKIQNSIQPPAMEGQHDPAKPPLRIPKGMHVCLPSIPAQPHHQFIIFPPPSTHTGPRRGAALLLAAGVTTAKTYQQPSLTAEPMPPPAKRPRTSTNITTTFAATALATGNDPLLRQPLPDKLKLLYDIFNAIRMTYDTMRRRGIRTTFKNLKQPVELQSGRRFFETHLNQLATLLPSFLMLETIHLPIRPGSVRTEAHVLLTMTPEALQMPVDMIRTKARVRLSQHLLDAYGVHLRALAREKHAAGDPEKAAELEAAAQQQPPVATFIPPSFPDTIPDIGTCVISNSVSALSSGNAGGSGGALVHVAATATTTTTTTTHTNALHRHKDSNNATTTTSLSSPRPVSSGAHVSFSRSIGNTATTATTTTATTMTASAQAEETNTDSNTQIPFAAALPSAPNARRLSFATCAASRQAILSAHSKDDANILRSLPEELRRRSLEGIISMDSLRVLEGNEAVHRRLSSAEARKARDESAALGALPRTFAVLRTIFGSRGPRAMKLRDVVAKMKGGGAETTTEEEIVAHLRCLSDHAPEYLQLKPWGRCGTPALWVDRSCDPNKVQAKLVENAAQAAQRRAGIDCS